MESIAKELDYELKSSMNHRRTSLTDKSTIQSVKWMKNSEDSSLKHPHTSLKDHSVLAVRCGAETQSIQ